MIEEESLPKSGDGLSDWRRKGNGMEGVTEAIIWQTFAGPGPFSHGDSNSNRTRVSNANSNLNHPVL